MISKQMIDNYIRHNGKIRVAVAGAGYIAKGLINQIVKTGYIDLVAIASRDMDKTIKFAEDHGFSSDLVLSSVNDIPYQDAQIIIDLTGDVETGAEIALASIKEKKHIISSAETDAAVGPVLAEMAREAGVIFTNMWGDEPGLIKGLYDYGQVVGFDVVALGKFKGFHNPYSTPETVKPWADKSGQNPVVISSFADGSKMSMEMSVVCNATGFVPDVTGMHLPEGTLDTVTDILKLKSEGGILTRTGVVEVVKGVQPSGGIYAVVRTDNPEVAASMSYYKMGSGPNYMLYLPYHMPGIEMIYGIYEMMLLGKSVVESKGKPVCDVMSIAKKDLKPGDILGPIGNFEYTGTIAEVSVAREADALPIGLAKNGEVIRPVAKGNVISMADVIIKEHDVCLELRKRYNAMIQDERYTTI